MSARFDAPSHRVAGRRLGHFGCSDGRGTARVVSVEIAITGRAKPPLSAVVPCPVCRERHTVGLLWREPRPDERGEIELAEDE